MSEEGFTDASWADDGDMGAGLEEAQTDELVEQSAVVGYLGRGIPTLELLVRVELGTGGAADGGSTVTAADLVGQGEQKQVLVGHFLLARQGKAIGQGIEQTTEFEASQHGLELWLDDIGGHVSSPSVGWPLERGRA